MIERPVVMGIINNTPDSFYSGSRRQDLAAVLQTAAQMLEDGATILDLGGQSTRPGNEPLSAVQESERVIPAIEAITANFPQAFISIDTYHAGVAAAAVAAGAAMVNDISGGRFDKTMLQTVASLHVPYICMHLEGTPQTMHEKVSHAPITAVLLDYFIERMAACREAGITDIIVDPGFGFSKTTAANFQLVKELDILKILNTPVLLGVSRKSTIYKTLNITAGDALNGTTVLNTAGLLNGASILRVHDVKEAMQAITLVSQLNQS